MATWTPFEKFSEDMASKVHDLRATGDTVKVYLTNTAPNAATHTVKADLAGITEQNGYIETDVQNTISRTGTTTTLNATDIVFTASGGSFGPFRYAVLFNDTPTSPADPLMYYSDYGSSITVADGENFTVDFAPAIANFG